MNIDRMLIVFYLLITLLFNSNALPFKKSNLTHLDSLYFKHNKRHKILKDRIAYIPKIPQCKAVNKFNFIHIHTFNPMCRGYISQFGHNDTKVYDSLNADVGASKNSIQKDNETGNFDSSLLNSALSPIFNSMKSPRASNRYYLKSKFSGNSLPTQWSFRDKDKMDDKVSEYETLMSDIEKLSKSKEKSDKDLYSFIQKNFKESTYDPELNLTSHEVMKAFRTQTFGDDLQEKEWIKYMNRLRKKLQRKLEDKEKIPPIPDPVDVNLETKAKHDSCGFRYPIEGTPDEVVGDPNAYKFWGRTPLSQVQTTHSIGLYSGKLEKKDLKPEDIITTNSLQHEKKINKLLKSVREANFKAKMDDILNNISDRSRKRNPKVAPVSQDGLKETVSPDDFRYKNIQFGNYYEDFKNDFLNADTYNQERILNLLNPYNPWEEYIKLRNLKSTIPPIGVNYKVNLKTLKVGFKSKESIPEDKINAFLKEYLHYFLILRADERLFEEFKNATFLYDILKYFDISYPIEVKELEKIPDLEDHFYKIYFPDLCPDGFPKPPPDPEFHLTMGNQDDLMALNDKITGKKNSYHRVNMVCCLMALAKCYPLARYYTSDIFTDQRIKTILDTLEKGLTLEMQRLEYGISDIEVNNLNQSSFCQIDGTFLSSLTDVLIQWNITSGVENILDLALLITLKRLNDIQGKHLVNIVRNISYLTTLPESVFTSFLAKIVEFVHEKLKFGLVNKDQWMELPDALDFLSLISNYKSVVTPKLMKTFVQLYRDSIVDFGRDFTNSYQTVNLKVDKKMENPNISSFEKRKSQIFPLVSCLQLSGLTEYMYLVDEVTKVLTSDDFELNSIASISVLETFNEAEEFQSRVIARTKSTLMRNKYDMESGRILKVLRAFTEGVKSGRLDPDSLFFCTMIKYFCLLKSPPPEDLVDACAVTDEFSPYLSRIQLREIFEDLSNKPLYFNLLTRLGLQGEFLEYPIATVAQVLYYSSKNNVIVQKNWETFYKMITIFKHILSMKDIMSILDALIISHFTNADELLDILCKRVCNLIEVTDVEPKRVFEVIEKCMELDYVPAQLLRFYAYWNMYYVQGADHVQSLLEGPQLYDVDFRGWKRPVTFDKSRECINLHHNMYYEVKMDGSRAHVPHSLRYSMQRPLRKPREFEDIERKQVDKDVLKELMSMVSRAKGMEYKFSETDQKIIDSMQNLTRDNKLNINF